MNIEDNLQGPVYQQGYRVLENKGTAIVGMSPGNSYFKKETIDALLSECTKKFSQIIIMIPDKPAVYTYKALGYTDMEAERKARLKSNALVNRTKESLLKLQKTYSGEATIVKWDSLVACSQEYKKEYENIISLYKNNATFREDARNTTRSVIEKKIDLNSNIEKSVDTGVFYLLSELAFVQACSKYYATDIAYVYHNPWSIYEKYVNGVYDGKKSNLGLVIIN